MMPLNHILKECTKGYELTKSQKKINYIKHFAQNEKELETLIKSNYVAEISSGG